MKSTFRLIVVCLGLSYTCSCRYTVDPDGLDRAGQGDQLGLITFVADTIQYTTYDGIAQQISAFPDARVSQRLEGNGQAAYFEAQVRVYTTDSRVALESFYLRFGDVDSSARFYQIRMQSNLFSTTLRINGEGIIEGTFSGLLDGTGVNSYGTTLLIRKGIVKIPFKSTAM